MPDQQGPSAGAGVSQGVGGEASGLRGQSTVPVTIVDQTRAIPGRLLAVNRAGGSFQLPNPPAPGTDVTALLFPPHPQSRSVWARIRVEWSVVQGSARVMSGFGARWLAVESADLDALRSIVGAGIDGESGSGRVEVVPAVTYSGKLYRFRPASAQRTEPIPQPPEPRHVPDAAEAEAVLLPATLLASTPASCGATAARWPAMVLAVTQERVWVALPPNADLAESPSGYELRTAFTTEGGLHDVILHAHALSVWSADPSLAVLELVETAASAAEQAAAYAYRDFVKYLRTTGSSEANQTNFS